MEERKIVGEITINRFCKYSINGIDIEALPHILKDMKSLLNCLEFECMTQEMAVTITIEDTEKKNPFYDAEDCYRGRFIYAIRMHSDDSTDDDEIYDIVDDNEKDR